MQKQIGSLQNISKKNYWKLNANPVANPVNTRVAKIIKYQPHGGSNHVLSVKSSKIEKEKGPCNIKLFYPV